MERLNLRNPKAYDMSSESETQKPRVRFYCVSEGPTEESYFYGVRNNKVELNIKGDVKGTPRWISVHAVCSLLP